MKPASRQENGKRTKGANNLRMTRPPNFSVKTPATKSLLKFRQRQEQQRLLKARQYKSYQRVIKREGLELSHTQRKRQRTDNEEIGRETVSPDVDGSTPVAQVNQVGENSTGNILEKGNSSSVSGIERHISETSSNIPNDISHKKSCPGGFGVTNVYGKKHRMNKKQQQKLREKELLERQKRIEKEKSAKLKVRQERHKQLSARTPRGQPIMNNIVQDILRKLQAEKASENK